MARAVAYTHTFGPNISSDQQALALYFEQLLVTLTKNAAVQIGALKVGDAGAFGLKLEQRFMTDGPKFHSFYRASAGSSVERIVYKYLIETLGSRKISENNGKVAGFYQCHMGTSTGTAEIHYALESTTTFADHFPSSFRRSRPDIRVALGAGTDGKYYEAIYDLTSVGGIGHILKKGDKWIEKKSVAFVSEIIWMDADIMHTGL